METLSEIPAHFWKNVTKVCRNRPAGVCRPRTSKWFAKYKWVMKDPGTRRCSLWGRSQARGCPAHTTSPEIILELRDIHCP